MRSHTRPSIVGRLRGLVLAQALLLAPLSLAATSAQAASGDCTTSGTTATCTFDYTGETQTWVVPDGVAEATFELYGAQGGYAWLGPGGLGGATTATLAVTPGETFQITVGGRGGDEFSGPGGSSLGGFNGGGAVAEHGSCTGAGGGGASDVRWDDPLLPDAFTLAERLLVAGGGGGDAPLDDVGGAGGGLNGVAGTPDSRSAAEAGGGGGSQTAGGTGGIFLSAYGNGGSGDLGVGGSGGECGGGGGGGYYGGGGGGSGGGGGGSGYATPAATGVSFETGVREGNGRVIVSYSLDTSAPAASPTQTPAANGDHWNNGDVTVSWNWADNSGGSGIDEDSCATSSTSSGEGALELTASCADLAGNQGSASYSVNVDKTAPTVNVTGVTNGASYPLGSVPAAGCTTSDELSKVATEATISITGGNADGTGSFTATCSGATDKAGNPGSASVSYTVAYRWSGFLEPIDSLPTLNSVKAGSAVPVTFSLGGNYGLSIFASGYPKVQQVACGSSAPTDEVEQTVTAGASGLKYDAASGKYTYTWKTDKKWAGSCRQLVLKLVDGTEHIAGFQFK